MAGTEGIENAFRLADQGRVGPALDAYISARRAGAPTARLNATRTLLAPKVERQIGIMLMSNNCSGATGMARKLRSSRMRSSRQIARLGWNAEWCPSPY